MTHRYNEYLPTLDNYWRAIILFGRNVASYKFALGKALLELSDQDNTFIPLDALALPYANALCEALERCDTQATSPSSQFLRDCRAFNSSEISQDQLLESTVRKGFRYVLDAFHNLNQDELPVRFFVDERHAGTKGIRLTDELFRLQETHQFENLLHEVDARWQLVEVAWELNLPRNTILIEFDNDTYSLFTDRARTKRRSITRARDSLNGYQKGKCFYCFDDISVESGANDLCEVDHFFPHSLKQLEISAPLDGVWNLVLACQLCNRDKTDRIPEKWLLTRLDTRNEFFIESHHPLRETILQQTGKTQKKRRQFLQRMLDQAVGVRIIRWEPEERNERAF